MNKIHLALGSRTFWATVLLVAVNVIPNLPVDQTVKDLINGVLGLVIAYFHVNPGQNYTSPQA